MSKTLLVTGGAGFIGAALVRRLLAAGHRVRVLDNGWRASRRLDELRNDLDLREADIRDAHAVRDAAKGVETVIHLASINGTQFFYSHPELILDVGIRGMLAVIDACRDNGVRDLVVASSSEVYQTPPQWPADESVPLAVPDVLNPRYSYGGQKIASELIAINYGRKGFDRVCIFRPHNVYGPDMGWEHVVPQFISRAVDAAAQSASPVVPFPMLGDGTQTRAFVHIDDFTSGLMMTIEAGRHLQIYNIGSEEELTMKAVAEIVLAQFGRSPEFVFQPPPPGETKRRCPDISRLRSLGFEPKIRFADGIVPVVHWYKEHQHLRPASEIQV